MIRWLALLFLATPAPAAPVDPQKPAIVLVHGIFDSGATMSWLAAQFAAQGYEIWCPSLTPSNGTCPLEQLSAQLDGKIRAHFPPGRALEIVGFSMGGVLARHWLQNHADLARVRGFATLSAPHHGSLLAWLLPLKGARDLRPGSQFLRGLAAGDERLRPLHPLSLRTPLDLMILPSFSSHWDLATNEIFWLPAHPLMIHSRAVAARLLRYFQELGSDK